MDTEAEATEYLFRLHGDHLAPHYQSGDTLHVREQDHATEGQLAVLLDSEKRPGARYYREADGLKVAGVVVAMSRVIP